MLDMIRLSSSIFSLNLDTILPVFPPLSPKLFVCVVLWWVYPPQYNTILFLSIKRKSTKKKNIKGIIGGNTRQHESLGVVLKHSNLGDRLEWGNTRQH